MRGPIIIALFLVGACASNPADPRPTACDRSDRHGVYLAEFTERSGTCGPVPSSLVNFDDKSDTGGCKRSGEVWSEGGCKLSTSASCAATAKAPAVDVTAVSTQVTQDGSVLEGVSTFRVGVSPPCSSTYDVRLVRQ